MSKNLHNWNTLNKGAKAIVREIMENTADDRHGPEGYKSNDESIEEIEFESRDGFMAFDHNRGGLMYRNFTDLMGYLGGGYTPTHEGAAKEIERQVEYGFKSIREDLYEEHKGLFLRLDIAENDIDYNSIDEYVQQSELLNECDKAVLEKILQDIQEMESERLGGNDASIMHELRFIYHGKENGVYTASVSAAVNTEGPYHRSHISWSPGTFCEGSKEVEIKWKTNAELKRKLDKAFKKVSKEIF